MTCVSPRLDDRRNPHDLDPSGLGVPGALPGSGVAPVEQHVEPHFELGSHRLGQLGGLAGEVALDIGDPVVDQQARGGEDIEGGVDVAVIARQLQHFAGFDFRSGSVLKDLQKPEGSDDVVGSSLGPPVFTGVVVHDVGAIANQIVVGAQGSCVHHGRVEVHDEERILAPGERAKVRRRSPSPLSFGLQARSAGPLEAHVREEQLLSITVRFTQVDGPAGLLEHAGLLEAETAGLPFTDACVPAAESQSPSG